jgi:proteasome alpha subunit
MKPLEVEILVVEIEEGGAGNEMYHVLYDGTITDHRRFVVIGGAKEAAALVMQEAYRENMSLKEAVRACLKALAKTNGDKALTEGTLEIAVLNQKREGRKFQRIKADEIHQLLEPAGSG